MYLIKALRRFKHWSKIPTTRNKNTTHDIVTGRLNAPLHPFPKAGLGFV
jgi:hypothetical protein